MKTCKECLLEKDESEFYKDSRYKNGIQSKCKDCKRQQSTEWRNANPNRRRMQLAEYYQENMEQCKLDSAEWYEENAEDVKRKSSQWKKDNPEKHRAQQAKRHALKLKAMPSWLSDAQLNEITAIYQKVKELQIISDPNDPLQVDHIVPLQGKDVCGLHVPWNLQILPRSLNLSKGSKLVNMSSGLDT